ncbi:LLM class flavin-dependent oxidoreductase [Alteromonas gracilis]
MDLSVFVPHSPLRAESLLPYAALTEWSSAVRLWQGQSMASDPHVSFAAMAGAGFRVPCATGVTLMAQRHPLDAALQARTVALATGHRFLAGIGPGAKVYQDLMLAQPYPSVLGAVRDYVTTMRALLDGETPSPTDTLRCGAGIAAIPSPGVDIGLGVLRPGMARLTGEIADVAITWLCPPAYLRDVIVPALREGAQRAGRPVPRVVAVVPFALRTPETASRDRHQLVLAANSAHLSAPHYRDMLHRAGVPRADDASGYVDAVIDAGAFVFETPEDAVKRLLEFEDAGVDEVAINPAGVTMTEGVRAGLAEIEHVLGLRP